MFVNPNLIPSTGNTIIDSEHGALAEALNQIYLHWQAQPDDPAVIQEMEGLLKTFQRHFLREQVIVRGAGYDSWQSHQDLHDQIITKMQEILVSLRTASAPTEDIDLFLLLERIIYEHEVSSDQEFWDLFREDQKTQPQGVLIDWQASWTIGHAAMDKDHRLMAEDLNAIYEAARDPDRQQDVAELLARLQADTAQHFDEEERILRSLPEEEQTTHKAAHAFFLEEIDHIRQEHAAGHRDRVVALLQHGLRFWFLDHICNLDSRLKEHSAGM